jgi:hypothetical protein
MVSNNAEFNQVINTLSSTIGDDEFNVADYVDYDNDKILIDDLVDDGWIDVNDRDDFTRKYPKYVITKRQFGESRINEANNANLVISAIKKVKSGLINKWKRGGGYENFGDKEYRALCDKFKYNPYGTSDERTIAKLLDNFAEWAMNYDGNEMEESNINELGSGDDWSGEDDNKPTRGDSVYLKTRYPDIVSRITYIDSTHVYWKTDSKNYIDTGNKGAIYHIGQLRDKELYNDLLAWMDTGDKTELENKLYTDI